jgi:CBS domain-containing protein
MFVHQLLPAARQRLAIVTEATPLAKLAGVLDLEHIDLAVVCNSDGHIVGVVTDSDVVHCLSGCEQRHPHACLTPAASVMSSEVLSCRPEEELRDVWPIMRERGLRHVPIIDESGKPVGVLYANDALAALLSEAETAEKALEDYFFGIGYG